MQFKEERETYLIEKMGGKFQRLNNYSVTSSIGFWSDWEYFGELLKWAKKQPGWGHIKEDFIASDDGLSGPLLWPILEDYIDPETFASAIFDYLRAKEEGIL